MCWIFKAGLACLLLKEQGRQLNSLERRWTVMEKYKERLLLEIIEGCVLPSLRMHAHQNANAHETCLVLKFDWNVDSPKLDRDSCKHVRFKETPPSDSFSCTLLDPWCSVYFSCFHFLLCITVYQFQSFWTASIQLRTSIQLLVSEVGRERDKDHKSNSCHSIAETISWLIVTRGTENCENWLIV